MTDLGQDPVIRRDLLLSTMFEVLRDAEDPLGPQEVFGEMKARLAFTDVEMSLSPSGRERATSFLQFASGWAVGTGWLDKHEGRWSLTPEGRRITDQLPVEGMNRHLNRLYREGRRSVSTPGADPRFDVLARLLDGLAAGAWTTYGDLASVTGLANQQVGAWVKGHEHPAAHRVLGADGRISPSFTWLDPDRTDDPQDVLEQEGIVFDEQSRAALAQRLFDEDFRDVLVDDVAESPRRAWLVRGSNVNGVDMVPTWVADSFCSLSAKRLGVLPLPASRTEIARAVEAGYADRSYNVRADRTTEFDLFLNRMAIGDLVLTPQTGGTLVVGRLTSDATLTASPDGRSNLRRQVEWLNVTHPVDFGQLPAPIAARLKAQRDVLDLSGDYDALVALTQPGDRGLRVPVAEPVAVAEIGEPDQALADALLVDLPWLQDVAHHLRHRRQVIFYGPPGTGKTYLAMRIADRLASPETVKLIQFHPAYSYEDFFEGYRPETAVDGTLSFALKPGPFKRLVGKAQENPSTAYVLIIDEINRANLAKVFGELYFLLEYRDENVDLLYSRPEDPPFTLPANVYLIGTMNTSDRSIALVDAAMRRRFAFVALHPHQPPTAGVLRRWLRREGHDEALADLHDALNARIQNGDFKIGPSYFMRPEVHLEGGLERMWQTAILPLLQEHHFGDGTDVAQHYRLDRLRAAVATTAAPAQEGAPEGQG
jgi:5-methylcytosine-specific restriction protein B